MFLIHSIDFLESQFPSVGEQTGVFRPEIDGKQILLFPLDEKLEKVFL